MDNNSKTVKAYFLAIFSCKSVCVQDKSPVFHQDGCLVSVLFSYFRKELAPNGAQTHSFLHDEIESSVKIAKKMMALAPVELLFYSESRESGSLFKIPFSVIISVIYCSAAR